MFDWQPLKTADVVLMIAALIGPILAVQAQKWIEHLRAKSDRRVQIYRTLMITRATRLAPGHVEALNTIPLDFYGVKPVMDRWAEYFDRLGKEAASQDLWHVDAERLFIAMMTEIGKTIGYKFNAAELKQVYFPQGHSAIQSNQQLIQHGLALWLSGQTAVKMAVTEFPAIQDAEAEAQREELRIATLAVLKNGRP